MTATAIFCVCLLAAWGAFALWFQVPGGWVFQGLGVCLWIAFTLAILIALWRGRLALGSVSFGVAAASLVTALFVPDRFNADSPALMRGIHEAFLVLGALTITSALVFTGLKGDDGSAVSQHKAILPAG